MKIVTAGPHYMDIDAYAGCIAYAELLRLQGEQAIAYSSATLNQSITGEIRGWPVEFQSDYKPEQHDEFVLVDVSDPKYVDPAVDIKRIVEVIDHHVGFEDFWQERIGQRADIEFIGAACTQVYERWLAAGQLAGMSQTSARLLVAGILDNTLNFKASVTTARDQAAYQALLKIANLPADWTARYFSDCQAAIMQDVAHALRHDTKMMSFSRLTNGPIAVGQLVVWDGRQAAAESRQVIAAAMEAKADNWLVNVVSISEGVSYFLHGGQAVADWAEAVLNVQFNDGQAQAGRLWLRKEIAKRDLESSWRTLLLH